MTKLDYRRGGAEPDPARVIEVKESGVWSGNDERPFQTEAQKVARIEAKRPQQAKARAALLERSEKLRQKQIQRKKALMAQGKWPPKPARRKKQKR